MAKHITVKQLIEVLKGYPQDFGVAMASVNFNGDVELNEVSDRVTINGPNVQLNSTLFVEDHLDR